jgi:transposase
LVSERKIDVPELPPARKDKSSAHDWETIDLNSLRHRDVREIGGEWLCYQALGQLGLENFLSSQADWSVDDARLALTHIISRAVYPASELQTSRWIKENSAVCELTGFSKEKITKDRLYDISKRLYTLKDDLERYLSYQTNELFDIEDKIVIFDLTNTYFEGEKRGSSLARHGRSKEKRSDAKLVVLALVINQFGFIKYSSILAGNVSDPSTLSAMIKDLRDKTSTTAPKALVVIDAGIATKENLAKIRSEGYDYICVTRSRLKDYAIDAANAPVTVKDNRGRKIQLQTVTPIYFR